MKYWCIEQFHAAHDEVNESALSLLIVNLIHQSIYRAPTCYNYPLNIIIFNRCLVGCEPPGNKFGMKVNQFPVWSYVLITFAVRCCVVHDFTMLTNRKLLQAYTQLFVNC
jgi:hypothetical protein